MTRNHDEEAAALQARTRELEEAIESKRAVIRKLQGLDAGGGGSSRWRRIGGPVEVEIELPPVDPETVHEALFAAIHRETGLVGAVRRRGADFEWKVFDTQQARRELEVRLEGRGDTPVLCVRGRDHRPTGMRVLAMATGMMFVVAAAAAAAVLHVPSAAVLIGVLALATLMAGLVKTRGRSHKQHHELAQRLSAGLPLQRPTEVRVEPADADDEPAEQDEPERESVSKRRSRGVP